MFTYLAGRYSDRLETGVWHFYNEMPGLEAMIMTPNACKTFLLDVYDVTDGLDRLIVAGTFESFADAYREMVRNENVYREYIRDYWKSRNNHPSNRSHSRLESVPDHPSIVR